MATPTPEQLRELFLFERLTGEQLDWVAGHGEVVRVAHDERVFREGDDATCFYVLLSGTIRMTRAVRGDDVHINRTSYRGSYFGATQAYLEKVPNRYSNSVYAETDCELFQLPAVEWGAALREWFPLAMHLLEGLYLGMRTSETAVGQRERLLALGELSAGLTHELNNPAAAAVRATESLRERVAGMRHKLAALAQGKLDASVVADLVDLLEEAVSRVAAAPKLAAMAASDAEDELSDWLDEHDVPNAWDLAPVLVAGGLDTAWLEKVKATVAVESLAAAVKWLANSVETEMLMNEITDATNRVSTLVGAARQYSQLDRAPHQVVDLAELLDSTLVMFAGKLAGIEVVKDYDPDLPPVPAFAGELNQVWTNIVDNALGAMGGPGTLRVSTRIDGQYALVVIGDSGPGIPAEIKQRIFEPFFTTKAVGEGTGLGLDISWRIVVKKHHGDLRVESAPGDTRFEIRLPLREPATDGGPDRDA